VYLLQVITLRLWPASVTEVLSSSTPFDQRAYADLSSTASQTAPPLVSLALEAVR